MNNLQGLLRELTDNMKIMAPLVMKLVSEGDIGLVIGYGLKAS